MVHTSQKVDFGFYAQLKKLYFGFYQIKKYSIRMIWAVLLLFIFIL